MKINSDSHASDLRNREAALEIHGDAFRTLGHQLVDDIAEFLDGLPRRPVTTGESPQAIRKLLGADILPQRGSPPNVLLDRAAELDH